MPRQKWNLTSAEKATWGKQVERLRAAGADLDISGLSPTAPDWIKITHYQVVCVHALPAASLFLIPTRIVSLAPRVVIQGFELSSPALDLAAWFLEDPGRSGSQLYRLCDGTDFHRTDVLNHRVDTAGTLRYGEVLEGMLIAQSFDAIPTRLADKSLIPICLSIINQFGDFHTSTTEARINRTADRILPRPLRRSSLFEREDGSFGNPELAAETPDGCALGNRPPEALEQGTGQAHSGAADYGCPGLLPQAKAIKPQHTSGEAAQNRRN